MPGSFNAASAALRPAQNTGSPGIVETMLAHSSGFVTTLDYVGVIDGKRDHTDWKTSNDVNRTRYAMQLMGQRMAYEEVYPDRPLDVSNIVRLCKDEVNYEVWRLEGDFDAGRTILRGLVELFHARHPTLRRTM